MSANEHYHQFEPSCEDTIHCFIYSLSLESDIEVWENLSKDINAAIAVLTEGYIWHRDDFQVYVPVLDTRDFPLHLRSITSFGDNIEDEWFIVHILLELTKQFPDLIAQVTDNDGDFLMIEAADYLPAWVNPDNTHNRVFIQNNHIHIIPPNLASVGEKLKLLDALVCIKQHPEQTRASPEIERAIINRIGSYPSRQIENIHNAVVKLPLDIAALLKLKPNIIAHIVNSYCHYDDTDIKACKTLNYDNTVTVTVKFTKCLYAMLLHSKVIKHIISPTEKDKSIIVGKKIACGFQMMMNRSDVFSSKEYHKFLKSLTDNGYFKNNIEGSQEYKKLLEKSKTFFLSVECPIISNIANNVSEIMKSENFLETKDQMKNSNESDLVEDNEDWLNVHPEQLNNMLNSRYGKTTKFTKNDIITPQNISSELTDFLKKSSDYEGIETDKKDQSYEDVEFEPDQFMNCVEKMLKLLSTNGEQEIDSFSDEPMSGSDDETDNELDQELTVKLQGMNENLKDHKSILQNMISSMKEEQASSGPSSNLMTTLGLNKTDFLDSDDD